MDLGFAGLVEKIEERFGKWAGTSIMAVLCFIVLAWGIQLFVGIFLEIDNMVASAGKAEELLGRIASLAFYGVIIFMFGFVTVRWQERRIRRHLAEMKKLQAHLETEVDKLLKLRKEAERENEQ